MLNDKIQDAMRFKQQKAEAGLPNADKPLLPQEIKQFKKKIGGYIRVNDGVIQKHFDPNPNDTLRKVLNQGPKYSKTVKTVRLKPVKDYEKFIDKRLDTSVLPSDLQLR